LVTLSSGTFLTGQAFGLVIRLVFMVLKIPAWTTFTCAICRKLRMLHRLGQELRKSLEHHTSLRFSNTSAQ
jgi:hypothetical protein